jgi:hypothetical protein
MGIFDSIKSIARGANDLLKKTKIISTLAPIVGTLAGKPGLGTAIGAGAGALGYNKGGRVLKMKKGGKVAKKPKAKGSGMTRPSGKKPKAKKAKKM